MPGRKKQSPQPITTLDPNLRWLNLREAAFYLRVSTQSVRHLIHDGQFKAARLGNNFRIDRADLDALMLRRKRVVAPYRRGTHPWVTKHWARERQKVQQKQRA